MISVIGVGDTEYSRRSGRSVQDLAIEAAWAAVSDAEIEPELIDGVIPLGGAFFTEDIIAGLGLHPLVADATPPPGGAAAVGAIALARSLVESGRATCVLLVLSRNGSSQGRINARIRQLPGQQFREQLERPQGWSSPAEWYAMICRRHMEDFGTTKRQMAEVALSARRHAQLNPRAMQYGRLLDLDRYLGAPMIADPYQLYDCCLETDGAAALIVADRDFSKSRGRAPIPVLAVETARPESADDLTNREDWHHIGLNDAAPLAYEHSGISPKDIDAAMIYDCFTFEVIHQLEAAGFCAPGEGGPFAASGALDIGGALPVNTHGGLLSEGHLSGLNHVIEAVRQLRGEAGDRQVSGAQIIAVTGWGDWGDGTYALLGRGGNDN
jgi:acetyl-CoA acetyltransferase